MNINTFEKTHPLFPKLLKEIPKPPEKIYLKGELFPNKPKIAIVGTRKATEYGKKLAFETAKELSQLGFVIVSGLAYGIDKAAHLGALSEGGKTIAVLASGFNKIYPPTHKDLAEKISENGALLTEYEKDTPSLAYRFLERNRIIAGLSIATIIIEAPEKSGALTTARLAAEYGREVFVFPGPINHKNFSGSFKLIRDGARLISSIKDILEDLKMENLIKTNHQKTFNLEPEEKIIFNLISNANQPIKAEEIKKITRYPIEKINTLITKLIIKEKIQETENGFIAKT